MMTPEEDLDKAFLEIMASVPDLNEVISDEEWAGPDYFADEGDIPDVQDDAAADVDVDEPFEEDDEEDLV